MFGRAESPALPCITDHSRVLFTSSGRAAIYQGMRALGVRPGDRVLLPTYHCPTMIAPAEQLGATPLFYPITQQALPDLEYLLRQDLTGVRTMLVAHYFGLPVQLEHVRQFCVDRGISLVEDCAHAFFGAAGGLPVGSTGDVAIASLTKFFPVTEGGCLVLRNAQAEKVVLSECGWKDEFRVAWDALELASRYRRFGKVGAPLQALFALKNLLRGGRARPDEPADPEPHAASARVRIDERLASRAASRTSRLIVGSANRTRIVERRRRNYELLCALLGPVAGLKLLFPRLPAQAAPYVCPVQVELAEPRYRALRKKGVPVMRWDQVWPETPKIPGDVGSVWSHEVFQLVCHQDMSDDDVKLAAATLIDVMREVHA